MEIDIIDLTSEEYANLTSVQLAMVRAAQIKKNEILANANQEKREHFFMLVSNRTARSTMNSRYCEEIDARAEEEIAAVRYDLTQQLAYEELFSEGNEYGPYRYPQNPNYNLTYPERFIAVRNYYMELTDDAEARAEAYAMDTLARTYLGEYYQSLYDLLLTYCESGS